MKQIVYVMCPISQQIYVWKLHVQYSELELIQVISTPGSGQPMVVHPNRQLLYFGVRPNFRIITYHINEWGLLIDNNISTAINGSPTFLTINSHGTSLYCASYQYNAVIVLPVNIVGIPGAPVQVIKNLMGCHSIAVDHHSPEYIWVPCLKEDAIRLFTINKKLGTLKLWNTFSIVKIKKVNKKYGPRHMVFHISDSYAYIVNELNSTINVIQYNYENQIFNVLQTLNIISDKIIMDITKYWAADIHITPNGRWLYCSERSASIISCFEISTITKKLRFANYQYTENQPRGFAIDCTGGFLIAAGEKSNYITLYSINPENGELNVLSRHQSGIGPMWINIILL